MLTQSILLQASVYPANPLFVFEIGSHVAQAGLQLATCLLCVAKDDMELLILMSTGVTGMCYYSQFMRRLR